MAMREMSSDGREREEEMRREERGLFFRKRLESQLHSTFAQQTRCGGYFTPNLSVYSYFFFRFLYSKTGVKWFVLTQTGKNDWRGGEGKGVSERAFLIIFL
jgi:hypothetical protein